MRNKVKHQLAAPQASWRSYLKVEVKVASMDRDNIKKTEKKNFMKEI